MSGEEGRRGGKGVSLGFEAPTEPLNMEGVSGGRKLKGHNKITGKSAVKGGGEGVGLRTQN